MQLYIVTADIYPNSPHTVYVGDSFEKACELAERLGEKMRPGVSLHIRRYDNDMYIHDAEVGANKAFIGVHPIMMNSESIISHYIYQNARFWTLPGNDAE